MLILVISLSLVTALFSVLYFLQRAQAKRLAKQLEKLNNEQRTQIVTMSYPSKTNQELVRQINRFLLDKQETEQTWHREERQLQERISNISHDMRTPLTAILGYIHLINTGNLSEVERQRYLSIIEARAKSLQRLLGDFYDLSRMDEGSYQLQMEPVDANGCCLELLAELYDDFEKAGIDLEVTLLPEAPAVLADKAAVRRIYENLFQNAKKHGDGFLWVSSRLADDNLTVSISNTCSHLTPEQLVKVFDRSYTASRSRSDGSTGLGLAICKSLIEKMGHEINLTCEDGVFTVQVIYHIIGGNHYELQ